MSFLSDYQSELQKAISHIDLAKVDQAVQWMLQTRDTGRHIFTCGNGGSASTASHFACDVVKGASYQRDKRFRVTALVDLMPTVSAYANDVGYDCIFCETLKNFAQPGDVLLAISASGNSINVLNAVDHARKIGCKTIGLSGKDGGKLAKAVELSINIPDQHMGRIEDAHLIICHMIAYRLMEL